MAPLNCPEVRERARPPIPSPTSLAAKTINPCNKVTVTGPRSFGEPVRAVGHARQAKSIAFDGPRLVGVLIGGSIAMPFQACVVRRTKARMRIAELFFFCVVSPADLFCRCSTPSRDITGSSPGVKLKECRV